MEKEKDSFFGTEGSRSEINEDVYSSGSPKFSLEQKLYSK